MNASEMIRKRKLKKLGQHLKKPELQQKQTFGTVRVKKIIAFK